MLYCGTRGPDGKIHSTFLDLADDIRGLAYNLKPEPIPENIPESDKATQLISALRNAWKYSIDAQEACLQHDHALVREALTLIIKVSEELSAGCSPQPSFMNSAPGDVINYILAELSSIRQRHYDALIDIGSRFHAEHLLKQTEYGRSAGGENPDDPKLQRGRPVANEAERNRDRAWYEKWQSDRYKTYGDLAGELSTTDEPVTERDVRLAIERHNKRLKRAGKKPVKSS